MCKHIHLLCRYLKAHEDVNTGNDNTQYDINMVINDDIMTHNQEGLQIVEVLSKTKINLKETQFSVKKEKIKQQMIQIIDSLTSSEELDIVEKIIAPLQPTLTAFKNSKKNRNRNWKHRPEDTTQ